MKIARVLQQALAEVDLEEQQLRARLDELEAERRGLELALRRHVVESHQASAVAVSPGEVPPSSSVPAQVPSGNSSSDAPSDWADLGVTEKVARILDAATEPIGPQEVTTWLEVRGDPQENTEVARSALAYLKRRGRARTVSRGRWVLLGSALDRALLDEASTEEKMEYVDGVLEAMDDDDAAPTSAEAPSESEEASVPVTQLLEDGGQDHSVTAE